jgi:uncharacterized repeat protein (TIGR03803 family)
MKPGLTTMVAVYLRFSAGIAHEVTGAETVLHAFSYADGAQPHATLLLFGNSLYGTASGGTNGGGVIFKIALGP